MKRIFALLLICILSIVGCTDNTRMSENNSLYYGTIELPENVFSVFALHNNELVYMDLGSNGAANIFIYDVNTRENTFIGTLEDYLMNPANNAFMDGNLYWNYVTRNSERKMISIDVAKGKMNTLITENDISGMVYSAATNDNIFSLKHSQYGQSIIECYDPADSSFSVFLETGTDVTIHAISTFSEKLYAFVSDNIGQAYIAEYDCATGKETNSIDVSFTKDIFSNSQLGYFQMIDNGFYIMNFSGDGLLYHLDGTSEMEYKDWAIATNTAVSYSQYSFFLRSSNIVPVIYDTNENAMYGIEFEMPDNYTIRYVYSDITSPERLLISLRNEETREEKVFITKITPQN